MFPLYLLGTLLLPACTGGDLFLTSADLGSFFALEKKILDILRDYVGNVDSSISKLQRYLEEYELIEEEVFKSEEQYLEKVRDNPLHAYHLVKRLTVYWNDIQAFVRQKCHKRLHDRLDHLRHSFTFPKEKDLHGAANAIIRLQDVYNLNVSDLSRGSIWDVQTNTELKAQDCTFMGKHCYNAGIYTRAIEWFEQAYDLAGHEVNGSVSQDQVAHFLDSAIRRHDVKLSKGDGHLHLYTEPLRSHLSGDRRRHAFQEHPYRLGPHLSIEEDLINFAALCRGENLRDDRYTAKLRCWVDSRGNPFYLLHPVKVEQHQLTPSIYSFHDVVSSAEIERLISLARPLLSRSLVQGQRGSESQLSNLRVSKTSWLPDQMDPLVRKISNRVSRLTGLKADTDQNEAEHLQIVNYASGEYYNLHYDFTLKYMKKVVNYGLGGHFSPHHDYLFRDKTASQMKGISQQDLFIGDRIATFMIYLSDVSKGGATAFPRIGLSVWPRKGSALFWHNLKESGQPDVLTLHGACPVLYGHKWVSNKWIREAPQVFRRPCDLDVNK